MPKLLIWVLRVALLLLTPVFVICTGLARWMMRLDAWTAHQLAARPAKIVAKPQLVHRDTPKNRTVSGTGGAEDQRQSPTLRAAGPSFAASCARTPPGQG